MKVIRNYAVGAIGVVCFMAVGALVMNNSASAAPPAKSAVLRGYYLTKDAWDGAQATTACSAGYHMASLYEILDPSNLKYNGTLGVTNADSGSGPPVLVINGSLFVGEAFGWVRTGAPSQQSYSAAGEANCNAYSSNSSEHTGSLAGLLFDWNFQTYTVPMAPWGAGVGLCANSWPVWYVQD